MSYQQHHTSSPPCPAHPAIPHTAAASQSKAPVCTRTVCSMSKHLTNLLALISFPPSLHVSLYQNPPRGWVALEGNHRQSPGGKTLSLSPIQCSQIRMGKPRCRDRPVSFWKRILTQNWGRTYAIVLYLLLVMGAAQDRGSCLGCVRPWIRVSVRVSKSDMVAHTYNLRTQEAEVRGSQGQGKCQLHSVP